MNRLSPQQTRALETWTGEVRNITSQYLSPPATGSGLSSRSGSPRPLSPRNLQTSFSKLARRSSLPATPAPVKDGSWKELYTAEKAASHADPARRRKRMQAHMNKMTMDNVKQLYVKTLAQIHSLDDLQAFVECVVGGVKQMKSSPDIYVVVVALMMLDARPQGLLSLALAPAEMLVVREQILNCLQKHFDIFIGSTFTFDPDVESSEFEQYLAWVTSWISYSNFLGFLAWQNLLPTRVLLLCASWSLARFCNSFEDRLNAGLPDLDSPEAPSILVSSRDYPYYSEWLFLEASIVMVNAVGPLFRVREGQCEHTRATEFDDIVNTISHVIKGRHAPFIPKRFEVLATNMLEMRSTNWMYSQAHIDFYANKMRLGD
ncbi:MAG: uncharacterized protein KVP18_000320 [Porospora cf. gigantea A]|uniref:uncharacterized protein n=1 Tax=Porospora cf. gigantea A TaxID=2853593 RepID=UPI0035594741|nr:MAG: hypothetical protein KVP18_000320 [Porospora cf. gigantea A]